MKADRLAQGRAALLTVPAASKLAGVRACWLRRNVPLIVLPESGHERVVWGDVLDALRGHSDAPAVRQTKKRGRKRKAPPLADL